MIYTIRARARMRAKTPSYSLPPTPYTKRSGERPFIPTRPDVIARTAGRADRLTAVKRLLCLYVNKQAQGEKLFPDMPPNFVQKDYPKWIKVCSNN